MKIRSLIAGAATVAMAIALPVVSSPAAHADQTTPGTYNTVPSQRILDTRSGQGAPQAPVAALGTLTFDATTAIGDGIEVGSVVLNVTAVTPKASGFLTVYKAGTPLPVASNLNFKIRQNTPNLVVTPVSANGMVSIYNGSKGTVDMLADIHGYYLGGTNAGDGGTFVPMASKRFLDTRSGVGAKKARVPGLGIVTLPIAGARGIPADATGVAANITAVNGLTKGFVTASQEDPRQIPKEQLTSTLNYAAHQDRANLALLAVNPADGTITLYNGALTTVDLLVDITGYYVGGTPAADGSLVPSSPARFFDTRLGGEPAAALTISKVAVPGFEDPSIAQFFKSVVVNVTAVEPQNAGFLTTYDGVGSLPSVSSSNFKARQDVAGAVIVPVNPDGTISIYNGSFGNVDLVVDVTGYVLALPEADQARGAQATQKRIDAAVAAVQKSAANGPASRPVSVSTPTR